MFDLEKITRENVQNMAPYSSARDEFTGEAKVFLDANELPYDTGYNRYPDPYQRVVKKAITEIKAVPEKNIFLGNGSDEVIDLLFRAFCEPRQSNVITFPPTYGMYRVSAGINDVEIKEVPLTKEYQLDTEATKAAVNENTRLIFVCSPNNPTGNLIATESIQELLKSFNGLVVVDEAYIDFANQQSFNMRLEEFPNLVVMQTFSKAWGMAGIRLGIGYASKEIITILNKIKPPYNINAATQQIILERIKDKYSVEAQVEEILEERERLEQELGNPEFRLVEKVYPSDANFLLIKFRKAAREIYNQLLNEEIVVRDRSRVLLCDDCLRITIGTREENELLIEKLKNINTQ